MDGPFHFFYSAQYVYVRACGQQLVSPRPAGADLGTRRQSQPRARTPAVVGACRPPARPQMRLPSLPGRSPLPFRRRRRPASQLPPRDRAARANCKRHASMHARAHARTHGGFCREPPQLVAWSGARRFSRALRLRRHSPLNAPGTKPSARALVRALYCFDHVTDCSTRRSWRRTSVVCVSLSPSRDADSVEC